VQTLWQRHSSDDLLYLFLVLIDAFVVKASLFCLSPLQNVAHLSQIGVCVCVCVREWYPG
jgi:hypothetical protein